MKIAVRGHQHRNVKPGDRRYPGDRVPRPDDSGIGRPVRSEILDRKTVGHSTVFADSSFRTTRISKTAD